MTAFNSMFPVLPGKEAAARAWIAELRGPRKAGFDALQERSEIARETLTLQETPAGAFLLFWFDGDVEKGFASVITGDDDFTVWHRAQLREVTGIDLAGGPTEGRRRRRCWTGRRPPRSGSPRGGTSARARARSESSARPAP